MFIVISPLWLGIFKKKSFLKKSVLCLNLLCHKDFKNNRYLISSVSDRCGMGWDVAFSLGQHTCSYLMNSHFALRKIHVLLYFIFLNMRVLNKPKQSDASGVKYTQLHAIRIYLIFSIPQVHNSNKTWTFSPKKQKLNNSNTMSTSN